MSRMSQFCSPVVLLFVAGVAWTSDRPAAQIYKETGVQGGLVVQIGIGDGALTAALRQNDSYIVHGLDTDADTVNAIQKTLLNAGVYGNVSVDHFDGISLPYADNLVNLVVSENLQDVPFSEVMRVLRPGGVAYIENGDQWRMQVKPWPNNIDDWSHYLHDASNNAVAADTEVGTPRGLKWHCGPLWSRSHEYNSSLSGMVTAGGRIFYVYDEGQTSITTKDIPDRWTLTARDAFNGVQLWKREVPKWGGRHWGGSALRNTPAGVPRLLVASEDRLYVALGVAAPISALDAATGETVAIYDQTEDATEMRLVGNVLLALKQKTKVLAIDVDSGKTLWQAEGRIHPTSLAATDVNVLFADSDGLRCLSTTTGMARWQREDIQQVSLLLLHDDLAIVAQRGKVQAISAADGKTKWSGSGVGRNEMFVAQNKLWHYQGTGFVGRSLKTGEVESQVDTDDVFTPGHHPRCYQGKATESFLIAPNRGVEFVSITGTPSAQNDWIRGACRYGVMPGNGLLYVPPHPCFCYPGAKLTGFNAFLSKSNAEGKELKPDQRLVKGPAYKYPPNWNETPTPWKTYRRNGSRSASTTAAVPAKVETKWEAKLGGRLTPPVSAYGRVFVAAKDEHTLYAFSSETGEELWRFVAGGRIDSPPTLHNNLVLFGCTDGRVYCLQAADGQLTWRFNAAPVDRRIVSFGQLESPWRVHGSVLVVDDTAYFTAGRSSYLDGGIHVFAVDANFGVMKHHTIIDSWTRTREDAEDKPFIPGYHMEGAQSDILVSQDDAIFLGQFKFDLELNRQDVPYILASADDTGASEPFEDQPFTTTGDPPLAKHEDHQRRWQERATPQLIEELKAKHGEYSLGHRDIGLHVFSTAGFLDDTWFNRTFWMYSKTWPGFYIANRAPKTGQLLVVGPKNTYALQSYPSRNLQSPLFTPGEKGYLLTADANDAEPVLDHRTQGTPKGWGFHRDRPPVWHQWLPIRIRGMVLADQHLFVAGPPDVVDPADPMAAFEGRKGAVLRTLAASDGNTVAETKLDSPPVFDGLIAAENRLFISTIDGKLICLAGE